MRRVTTTPTPATSDSGALLLQWASESGAHGMPVPQELERMGWHRLAEHPLFRGTWLMETRSRKSRPFPKTRVDRSRILGGR
jgi:hypothetical protein